MSTILEKVHYYLPRVPKLKIKLFKDLNGESDEEDAHYKDMQITLKSSYKDTTSQMQLNQFLEVSES